MLRDCRRCEADLSSNVLCLEAGGTAGPQCWGMSEAAWGPHWCLNNFRAFLILKKEDQGQYVTITVLSCTEQSLQAACNGKAFGPPRGNEMQVLCYEGFGVRLGLPRAVGSQRQYGPRTAVSCGMGCSRILNH